MFTSTIAEKVNFLSFFSSFFWVSFLTLGMSKMSPTERRMFKSPKEKKGRVKPPKLYKNEPTAGPEIVHYFFYFVN